MAPDVDYMAVASMTDGMVGAELANIIEVAAINTMRDGRAEVFHVYCRKFAVNNLWILCIVACKIVFICYINNLTYGSCADHY